MLAAVPVMFTSWVSCRWFWMTWGWGQGLPPGRSTSCRRRRCWRPAWPARLESYPHSSRRRWEWQLSGSWQYWWKKSQIGCGVGAKYSTCQYRKTNLWRDPQLILRWNIVLESHTPGQTWVSLKRKFSTHHVKALFAPFEHLFSLTLGDKSDQCYQHYCNNNLIVVIFFFFAPAEPPPRHVPVGLCASNESPLPWSVGINIASTCYLSSCFAILFATGFIRNLLRKDKRKSPNIPVGPTHVDAQYAWTKWWNAKRLGGLTPCRHNRPWTREE